MKVLLTFQSKYELEALVEKDKRK